MPEKYKDEIEEILRQAEDVLHPERTEQATSNTQRRYVLRLPKLGPPSGLPRFSAGNVMLSAIAIFLVAVILRSIGGPVMPIVGIGLALFVLAYFMFFFRPGTPRTQKRWRGRLMEEEPTDLLGRVRRWFRG